MRSQRSRAFLESTGFMMRYENGTSSLANVKLVILFSTIEKANFICLHMQIRLFLSLNNPLGTTCVTGVVPITHDD